MAKYIEKFQNIMASDFIDSDVEKNLGLAATPIKAGFEVLDAKLNRMLIAYEDTATDAQKSIALSEKNSKETIEQVKKLAQHYNSLADVFNVLQQKVSDKLDVSLKESEFERFEQYVRKNKQPLLKVNIDFNKTKSLIWGIVVVAVMMLGIGFYAYHLIMAPESDRWAAIAYHASLSMGNDNAAQEYDRITKMFLNGRKQTAIAEAKRLRQEYRQYRKDKKKLSKVITEKCRRVFPAGVEVKSFEILHYESGDSVSLVFITDIYSGKPFSVFIASDGTIYVKETPKYPQFSDLTLKNIKDEWTQIEVPEKSKWPK